MDEVDPGWRKQYSKLLGLGRTSYYVRPAKQAETDRQAIARLQAAHELHPFYGVDRLALHLGWNKKKTRRIRTLAGVIIPTPTKKRRSGWSAAAEISAPPNALQCYARLKDELRPQDGQSYADMVNAHAWAQDFTYLWFENRWHYLAVVLDLKTRQVVGWRLGTRHTSELTHEALLDALSKHPAPAILHSDQGSEYLSYRHQDLCNKMEIQLSASTKASPWQNGFMERWFGGFKREVCNLTQYKNLAALHEAIALHIYYYNHKRIHSALKMSPAAYAASLNKRDRVFAKRGG
ncbi:MAG: IS3 family transposase [Candidatus Saccharimonadales bacterium]